MTQIHDGGVYSHFPCFSYLSSAIPASPNTKIYKNACHIYILSEDFFHIEYDYTLYYISHYSKTSRSWYGLA